MPRTMIKNSAESPSKRRPKEISRLGIQGSVSVMTPRFPEEPGVPRISGRRIPTAKASPPRTSAASHPAFRPMTRVATIVTATSANVAKRIAPRVTDSPAENMNGALGTRVSCSPHSRVGRCTTTNGTSVLSGTSALHTPTRLPGSPAPILPFTPLGKRQRQLGGARMFDV